ncbi:MAG TPA: hypothetical protein VID19_09075, partial [Candidatus Eremiobacteraceae bacterium]
MLTEGRVANALIFVHGYANAAAGAAVGAVLGAALGWGVGSATTGLAAIQSTIIATARKEKRCILVLSSERFLYAPGSEAARLGVDG